MWGGFAYGSDAGENRQSVRSSLNNLKGTIILTTKVSINSKAEMVKAMLIMKGKAEAIKITKELGEMGRRATILAETNAHSCL